MEEYLYKCEKHNYEKMIPFLSLEGTSPCPHCNDEHNKYCEEQIKKGYVMCHGCGDGYKPNKRIYLLCDPEERCFRYKEPSKEILDESCGVACSKKCQIDHEHYEGDSGPYGCF